MPMLERRHTYDKFGGPLEAWNLARCIHRHPQGNHIDGPSCLDNTRQQSVFVMKYEHLSPILNQCENVLNHNPSHHEHLRSTLRRGANSRQSMF